MNVGQQDPIDGLFALPPEDFTAARDGLAKRLHAEGDADAARQVRQLRRPTVPAWAVDQLARTAPEDLQRLLSTSHELRRAQRAALSGAGGGRLRAATARRRALLDELTERAARLLADAGRSPDPHRAAIAATLEAATVDGEAADLVRSGRLSRELPPPSGFGGLSGLTLVPDADDADATGAAAEDEEAPAAPEPADPTATTATTATTTSAEPTARQQAAGTQEATEAREQAEEEAEEATRARERADAALETVRDLERRLSEAHREREETERAATEAAKRARAAADRAGLARGRGGAQ